MNTALLLAVIVLCALSALLGAVVIGVVITLQNRQADRENQSYSLPTTAPPGWNAAPAEPEPEVAARSLDPGLYNQVYTLVRNGRKLEAIQVYREASGEGLDEAWRTIEAIEVSHSQPASITGQQDDLNIRIRELLARGQKLEAIKIYRQATGVGLKEALQAVEAVGQSRSYASPGPGTETAETAEPSWPPASPSAAGASPDFNQLWDQVTVLLKEGKKIEAIKAFRQATGVGLKEAKEAVEAAEQSWPPASPGMAEESPNFGQLWDQVTALLKEGKKLEAIKVFRQATGAGFKEAMEAVETIEKKMK